MNTILVADDSISNMFFFREILETANEGYSVISAENGLVAYEKAIKDRPDVILMDIEMPVMDGIEALLLLKQNPLVKDIPVIVITASEKLNLAFESGAVDFIRKPVDKIEFLSRVKSVVSLVRYLDELKDKNIKIQRQHEEIIQKRDHLIIQKKEITDSIQYAKHIQKAVMPPVAFINSIFPEHFIFFEPRDIVSGDFYWFVQKNEKIIFAVGDCTGHGVPGAFMSMLGIAFLNEILNRFHDNKHVYTLQANEILNNLREKVIKSLHQTGRPDESKDGLDLALCIFDLETKMLQYSGANNPVYIMKNHELIKLKADKMPIGIFDLNKPFTNQEIQLANKDIVYLFTDGYIDQFGGENGKKFLSERLSRLLTEIHELPMDHQKAKINEIYKNWRGQLDQVDDITVMGIKITETYAFKKKKLEYQWNDKLILIIEDTENNFLYLLEALNKTGVQVIRAKDGFQALEICKSITGIDLILVDIQLPEIDGYETTKLIKALRNDIPIIAHTAYDLPEAKLKSIESGCVDFIPKPIKLDLFLQIVGKYI